MLLGGKIFSTTHFDQHWQRRFLLALLWLLAVWPLGNDLK
jgi:hypothetical protein